MMKLSKQVRDERGSLMYWHPSHVKAYLDFVKAFRPEIRVFVRNNVVLDERMDPTVLQGFETGRLAIFHTSSEVQPRGQSTERRYEAFLRWARPGKTTAYAESWADAWGRHGSTTDSQPIAFSQLS